MALLEGSHASVALDHAGLDLAHHVCSPLWPAVVLKRRGEVTELPLCDLGNDLGVPNGV
jgi:hypothetical protein